MTGVKLCPVRVLMQFRALRYAGSGARELKQEPVREKWV